MRDFKDIFKTPEWSFVNAFSVCMTVPVSRDQGNGGEGGRVGSWNWVQYATRKILEIVKFFVGKKWRIFRQMRKIVIYEKLMPTKIITGQSFYQ